MFESHKVGISILFLPSLTNFKFQKKNNRCLMYPMKKMQRKQSFLVIAGGAYEITMQLYV